MKRILGCIRRANERYGMIRPGDKICVGVSGGNRIVGIISHVAELKDRIDRQIIVTKDRSGGSRVQVQA